MAMAAVRAETPVGRSQRCSNADRDRFLADAEVTRAHGLTRLDHARDDFLCTPDEQHCAVPFEQLTGGAMGELDRCPELGGVGEQIESTCRIGNRHER